MKNISVLIGILLLTVSMVIEVKPSILLVSGKIYNSTDDTYICVVSDLDTIYKVSESKRFMIPPLRVTKDYIITFKSVDKSKVILIKRQDKNIKDKKVYNQWVSLDWDTNLKDTITLMFVRNKYIII